MEIPFPPPPSGGNPPPDPLRWKGTLHTTSLFVRRLRVHDIASSPNRYGRRRRDDWNRSRLRTETNPVFKLTQYNPFTNCRITNYKLSRCADVASVISHRISFLLASYWIARTRGHVLYVRIFMFSGRGEVVGRDGGNVNVS